MYGAIPSRHPKYRTKLCRNFANGDCPFGQECSFLHPPQRINPATCSITQQLFPWNPLLLKQLLTLCSQQATVKKMQRRSPPRSQGPLLVEEDPSPTTSLLLSKSDCTSSEQIPQTKRSDKRKKHPCRHFVRTGGWCPARGQCKFQHDMDALPSPGGRKTKHPPPSTTDTRPEPLRSPEAELMGRCSYPRHPYSSSGNLNGLLDQPTFWLNHPWQSHQACHAAVLPMTMAPMPTTATSDTRQSLYPQAQTMPSNENRANPPPASYEMNGTTYFPASLPSFLPPPPAPYLFPVHPLAYNLAMAPAHPYYAPPGMPAGYYDINLTQAMAAGPQTLTALDPFASDRVVPGELPVIPRLEEYPVPPVQSGALGLLPARALPTGELGTTTAIARPAPEHEFPYRPPKEQQVGHARRISVDIKKRARVNSR